MQALTIKAKPQTKTAVFIAGSKPLREWPGMSVILILSTLVLCFATIFSIASIFRTNNRKVWFFAAMLAAMTMYQFLALLSLASPGSYSNTVLAMDVLQLLTSLAALVLVLNLESWQLLGNVRTSTKPPGNLPATPAFVIGLSSAIGIAVISYFAFVNSRNEIRRLVANENLSLGETVSNIALLPLRESETIDPQDALTRIGEMWKHTQFPYAKSYMCVIDSSGKIALHTTKPEMAGTDVSQNLLSKGTGQTVGSLLKKHESWSGQNYNFAGVRQLVGYHYEPSIDSLIAVHIPANTVDAGFQAAVAPWLWSMLVIGGLVFPCSQSLLFYCSRRSNLRLQSSLSELVASETRFRSLMEALPNGVEHANPDGQITFVNPVRAQMHGRPVEELIGKHVWDFEATEELRDRLRNYFLELVEQQPTPTPFETTQRTANGNVIDIRANWTYRRNAEGKLIGVIAVITDITERKRAEALIHAENEILEAITSGEPMQATLARIVHFIESQSDDLVASVLVLDREGKHLHNGASISLPEEYVQAIEGMAIGESAGSCGTAAFRGEPVFVDDISTDPLWRDFRELAAQHHLAACWSTPIKDPSGTVLGTLAIYRRVPGPIQPMHRRLIEFSTHLTAVAISRHRAEEALLRSEAKFRTIFEQAAVGVGLVDSKTGRFLQVNENYREILGLPADQVLSRTWMELTHPDDLAEDLAKMDELRAGVTRHFNMEKRLVKKDGEIVWIDLTVSPMWQPGEHPTTRIAIAIVQDITKRKTAEQQLRFTKFSVDACNTSIFWIRRDARFMYVNDAALNTFGYTREELLAMTVHDIDPGCGAISWSEYWEQMRGQSSLTLESKMKHRDGAIIPVEVATSLLNFEGDEFVFAFVSDIRERYRSQAQLRESNELFRGLVETSPFGIQRCGVNGLITFANSALGGIYGCKPEDLLGHSIWEFAIDDTSRQAMKQYVASDARNTQTARSSFETRNLTRDGRIIDVNVDWTHEFDPQRNVTGFTSIITDITKKKESERALAFQADVLKRVSDAVFVTNGTGAISYINEVAARLLQDTGQTYVDRMLEEIHDEWVVSGPSSKTIHASIREHGFWHGENEIRVKDEIRCYETKVQAVQSPNSVEQAMIAVVRDITERKLAERESRQHRESLAHTTRLSTMGELVAGIAHELKQPLHTIANYGMATSVVLEKVRQTQSGGERWVDEIREWNAGIRQAALRASEIIQRLRDFSRKDEQHRDHVDVNQAILDSINLVAFEAREGKVKVITELGENLPTVWANRIQLEQVIVNLLHNAYEALTNRELPRKVVVRTQCLGGMIEISVQDNGPGIPPETQATIFDAFSTTKPTGLGLGLAISRTIVEDHAGTLRVQANSNQGARFCFTMPASMTSGT
jgi:PAS domain S-box-containing protein